MGHLPAFTDPGVKQNGRPRHSAVLYSVITTEIVRVQTGAH